MTHLTRVFDRKQRIKQQAAQDHEQEQRERQAVLGRALKFAKALPGEPSPAAQIKALEAYIVKLQAMKKELATKYPGYDKPRSPWNKLDIEIEWALSLLTELRIGLIKPEKAD
jgi:hypothetical protein